MRAKRACPPQELEFTGPEGPEILVDQISGVTFFTFFALKFLKLSKFEPNPVTQEEMSLFWPKMYKKSCI